MGAYTFKVKKTIITERTEEVTVEAENLSMAHLELCTKLCVDKTVLKFSIDGLEYRNNIDIKKYQIYTLVKDYNLTLEKAAKIAGVSTSTASSYVRQVKKEMKK